MMSVSKSGEDDFKYPPKPITYLSHECICGWEECRHYQQFFTDHLNTREPDYHGGLCQCLDLSGSDKKQVAWHKAVLSNIFGNVEELSFVPVAWHHWSIEQNKYFDQNNKMPLTPLPQSVVKKMSTAFDEEDQIMTKNGPLFFNTPNVPLASIKAEVELPERSD